MLTDIEIREVATNLRKLASDPLLKKKFNSETRKTMNDLANTIMESTPKPSESPK